jgi:outer membrane protein assembly factor BamD
MRLFHKRTMFLLGWLMALGFCGTACGLFGTKRGGGGSYSANARDNYEKGLAELKARAWAEAIRYFQFARSKFSFSKWATLAELRIADAELGRERYSEAIDAYRTFIKDHPTHEMTQNGYAAFKIGETFYEQIPGQWFLVPAGYEKDQGPAGDALRELQGFIAEYPDSPYVADARKRIGDCVRRLADHELYVARFYLNRNKTAAAIGRLEALLREYPHSSLEPSVLLLLAQTYLKQEKPMEAQKVLERLVADYPEDFHAKKAKLFLGHIARRYGT